ncbi:hypothetical protein SUNI508_09625 [Seiridium unicorne]|uniref:Uncharacterized protein n=1 Tax=Seiridium unicorne TaxID=138068 RepID=A0ABR2UQ93_9PEZI
MTEKATPVKKGDLTARETEVLAAAWQCMKTEPEIDMAKLATLTGYTNPRSVGNTMAVIKKKLVALAGQSTSGGAAASAAATPASGKGKGKAGAAGKKTPASRKRKSASEESDIDEDNVDSPTPAKKARAPRGTKAKTPAKVPKEQLDKEEKEVEAKDESGDEKISAALPMKDEDELMDSGEA